MKINPAMFRAYDLRGIVDRDLTPEIMEQIGKAYGTYLTRRDIKTAIVGRDCRATSEAYAKAFAEGIAWAGVDVTDIGLNLVGTFYWSQYFLKIKGGAFVTASHNPAEYNGLKIAIDYSETMVADGMAELCRMVQEDDIIQGQRPGVIIQKDIKADYLKDVAGRLPVAKKFKVLIDPSHSTAGAIVPEYFRQLGFEVIEKHCNIDPSFPLGTPDPTEESVANRLSEETVAAGADVGFTFDADGDRIGIVAEDGTVVWNDVLVAIFATDVLRAHPGAKIMFNTLCSKVVPDTILKNGGEPFMWRTGHSFLKKKNQTVKAAFIGELSGHFFFSADFYNHDDGFYSALRLLHYMDATGKPLSQLINELPHYISSPEVKVGSAEDKKVGVIARVSLQAKKDFPDLEVIDDERAGDGVRLEGPDSMFVIRYSQNGPYLTVKFEAKTAERYEELRSYIYNLLKNDPDVSWAKDNANITSLTGE